jgi:hypothetical protein
VLASIFVMNGCAQPLSIYIFSPVSVKKKEKGYTFPTTMNSIPIRVRMSKNNNELHAMTQILPFEVLYDF